MNRIAHGKDRLHLLSWFWLIGLVPAAFFAVTLGYQVVTGQPIGANTLLLTDAASGSAPAVRANGQDANISINIVPKGTGTVQVNGVPVAAGTATSLTINPGPLAVTGTTNLTGPLFVTPGTNGILKGVGARIFHTTTDVPTTGLVLQTLYSVVIPANTLAADGQSLRIVVDGTTAANVNNKTLTITFGATNLIVYGPAGFNNSDLTLVCDLFRTGAATQKSICRGLNIPLNVTFVATGGAALVTTPAETLSNPVTLLITGTTPTLAGELTARIATVDWYPAGQ